ncbi:MULTISPECIES: aminopeptidase [unclassified Oleiphilus]|nr:MULTISPECIES: aminopeptidase [unclassified Oleiphilus]KZY44941.1 hypothetical protein A3732_01370 [Oleiphilus sp. HI0050]KZY96275.1 hypothetical protein A3743_04720 [Oleiphilus sp. HI0072]KZZ16882.1 hypothetical protein A3749_04375 [Oleiphilus sp. HI0078]KZY37301.1 hypothetical protein A3729_03560 [Oleiphilus sp. HI0043]KZY59516.1 hypothetical protein A3735_00340 [Oleiphilus sp. HI0061]
MRKRLKVLGLGALCLSSVTLLSACSSVSYYSHLLNGQTSLLWNREPVETLLADDETSEELRKRLILSQALRDFASKELNLPVDDAYTSYTDLGRRYAVWNVYAASELSLDAYTWCYPILGCLAYRGYYDQSMAKAEALRLEKQGFETRVGGVRAYSTLGFFDDPLLSSFIFTDEVYLVELLIHEISHRKLYIKNDTKFNENFATAVGTIGAELWYKNQSQTHKYQEYQQAKAEQKKLMSFVLSYKDKLHDVYQDDSWSVEKKRKEKDKLLKEMKLSFQSLKQKHAWDSRYDRWVNELNNAGFSTLSNYQDLVPGFIALYHRLGEDWDAFYQEVERLSELDKSQRHAHLKSLSEAIGEHQ